jgi:hypothetical protein
MGIQTPGAKRRAFCIRALMFQDHALCKNRFPRHNACMRKAFVLLALIALSLGLGACSKCEAYRFWTTPKVCAGS